MMNGIVIFFRLLIKHKWKIMLTISMTITFLVLLFPLSDLNDLISSQVSKLTNNRVFIQFDKMHLNPLTASLSLEKVYVDTTQISSLTSRELSLRPSIAALIAKKPGGTINAKGFLKGDLEISVHPTSSSNGVDKSKIDINANNLSLSEARDVANISLPIKGQLSITSQALADLTMTEQPEMDLNLTIMKFEMASTFVPLNDFGQIALPEIKMSKVELKGRLSNGKFIIETGKLGSSLDEVYGDIKGDLSISFQNINGQITPVIGAYNISLDIKAKPSFKDKAKLFLSFLDGYKVDAGAVSNYKFKVFATAMGIPPQFTPMN
jgi:type II secretion system protein N